MTEPYDEAVDEELVQGRMKLICAWHPKLFGTEKVMREAAPGHEGDGVSHGICGECLAIVRREQNALADSQEIGR